VFQFGEFQMNSSWCSQYHSLRVELKALWWFSTCRHLKVS